MRWLEANQRRRGKRRWRSAVFRAVAWHRTPRSVHDRDTFMLDLFLRAMLAPPTPEA